MLSFTAPVLISSILILYSLHWLTRSFLMSARLIVGYIRYRHDIRRDWLQILHDRYTNSAIKQIYQLVIIATSKERYPIVRSTLEAIQASDFPKKQLLVVLATEERFADNSARLCSLAQAEFGKIFGAFITSIHPKNLPGEVVGKGGNLTWAGRQAKKYLDRKKIPYNQVICTTLDSDNRVHRKYFSALACAYLAHPAPKYASFQPIPMFFNNIWEVPLPIRSIALGSSFWQIIESTRPYRLRNFSAHAQSFEALVATDFWSTTTIVEDGHQFWRTYFRFHGRHEVIPLNVPVYQDAVLSPRGYWATFREQYIQKRRWAWGCSDIPFVLIHAWQDKKIPFLNKWIQVGRLVEGHFSWASTSIILAFFSWLPRLANPEFQNAVLAYTFPPLYGRILALALSGMIVTLTISTLLLPPIPKKRLKRTTWNLVFEWLTAPFLLPISNVLFSSLPAIEAQTRLMLGKRLEFKPTEKHIIRQDISNHPAAE
ncbi:glycosyltransferase family 2 protein [Candidatus Berkelbacteria bacterium]|nr:glycosyltransferase family 2 protein [Candidatus Berkelbacteria bacterium]